MCLMYLNFSSGSAHAQAANPTGQQSTQASPVRGNRIDEQFFFQVLLNAGDSQSYNLWGELRSPASSQGRTLLILGSGIT